MSVAKIFGYGFIEDYRGCNSMGDIIKRIILGLAGVLVLGAVAYGIVMLLFNADFSSDDDSPVEIGNADAVVGMDESTFEATIATTEARPEVQEVANVPIATPADAGENSADAGNANTISNVDATVPESGMVDKSAPKFLISTKSIYVDMGTEFNIHDYVGYADDVDRDVDLKITGEVDTSKEDSYPISVLLTDDSGKTTNLDVTVNVVPASGSSEPAEGGAAAPPTGGETFAEFEERYKEDNTVLGIDVSRWQNGIDFNKVKEAGCEFVIIRLGGYDDGEHYTDRNYNTYIKDAKAAGLKVGIYWHAEERNEEEVKRSVAYLLRILDGEKLDFPIAYDWEDFLHFEDYGMNIYDINNNYSAFSREIKAAGYDCCNYSSKNFLENVWTNGEGDKIWLANYTSQTSYAGEYYMWQQSSKGRIDGISTYVDFNVLYTDKYHLGD